MQLTQQQFVEDCLAKYRWEPLPADQKWDEAHYPQPKCLGGKDTIKLWAADHVVQGLLQSVELDHQCFHHSGDGKDSLNLETYYPEYLLLFKQLKSKFRSRQGRKSGASNAKNKTGFCAPGVQSANGKKTAEMGVGIHAPGMQSAGGEKGNKITNVQKWQCLVTGFISTPGPLARYQKARGIDTKLRVKLS